MGRYVTMQVVSRALRDDLGDVAAVEIGRMHVEAKGLHPLSDSVPAVTWEEITPGTMAIMRDWLYSADGVALAEPGDWIARTIFHVTEEGP